MPRQRMVTPLAAQDHFVAKTRSLYPGGFLPLSDSNRVKAFISKAAVQYGGGEKAEVLTPPQREQLTASLYSFFVLFEDPSAEKMLRFRSILPFKINLTVFEKDSGIESGLEDAEIKWPADPEGKVKALWQLKQYERAQEAFAAPIFAERRKKQERVPETIDDLNAFYSSNKLAFHQAVAAHPEKFGPSRIQAISTNYFRISIEVRTNASFSLGHHNSAAYQGGFQMTSLRWADYENSIESIIKEANRSTVAIVSFVAETNTTQGKVPITVCFYWSPADKKWLPDRLTSNNLGGFLTFF